MAKASKAIKEEVEARVTATLVNGRFEVEFENWQLFNNRILNRLHRAMSRQRSLERKKVLQGERLKAVKPKEEQDG